MNWIDIACIVFSCVTANHLGLIGKLEEIIGKLPIINCPKCSTYWFVLAYMVITTQDVILSLAISFLASYVAIWLELFEGYIDTLYLKLYGKTIRTEPHDKIAADAKCGDSTSAVS